MSVPRISLVIPAWNEEQYLPGLLASVDAARERYRHGGDAVEVIVADNGSTDATAALAREKGCVVVSVEERAIAAARNGGAHQARGDILAFVDADTLIHPDTFTAIDDVLRGSGRAVVAGATGARPDRLSFGIAATAAMVLPLVWLTGFDSGVVFCRREDFTRVGGFDKTKRFGEDVAFLWAMRRLGGARAQKLCRLTSARATTSTRKFDRYGEWHYLANFLRSGYWFLFDRERLHSWADEYWYRER